METFIANYEGDMLSQIHDMEAFCLINRRRALPKLVSSPFEKQGHFILNDRVTFNAFLIV